MEMDTSDGSYSKSVSFKLLSKSSRRAFVFLKAVNEHSHSVIPELYAPIMQRGSQQWLRRVEGKACERNVSGTSGSRGGQAHP